MRWAHVALVALAVGAAAGPAPVEVDELLPLVDPARDSWAGEQFAQSAGAEIERLTGWLERRTAAGLEGARSTPLRPPGLEAIELADGTRVAAWHGTPKAPELGLREALVALVEPLGATPRFELRILDVTLGQDLPPRTTVLYRGVATGARIVQQSATWSVSWSRGAGEEEAPRIAAVGLLSFEEVARDGPMLADTTGSVLPPGPGTVDNLQWGGDYWHGRVDLVGGSALTGHNGLAVADVNGDGLEDLYVAMGNSLPNLLFVQNGDGTVREVARESGVAWLDDTKGALFADLDNDGDQDLVVAIGPSIVLCRNDGQGHFAGYSSLRAGRPEPFYSLSVSDFDRDGDLDLFGTRSAEARGDLGLPLPLQAARNGPPHHLLRNDGERGFVDVTAQVGLDANDGRFSLAAAWADYDGDGDADLVVANRFGPLNLYRNDGAHFVDVATEAGLALQAGSTGASWGDYDLDGDLDLYISGIFSTAAGRVASEPRFAQAVGEAAGPLRQLGAGGALFVNQGDGTFNRRGEDTGPHPRAWGWGGHFVDLDDDGYDEIVVPRGFLGGTTAGDLDSFFWRQVAASSVGDQALYLAGWKALGQLASRGAAWSGGEHPSCQLNLQGTRFAEGSSACGLEGCCDGRAVATVDWDGDGDLDLWLRSRSGPQLRFLQNKGGPAGHWITLGLEGTSANRDAVGAVVELTAGGLTQRREVASGDGYLAQSSRRLHFGLGRARQIERIVIRWPGGEREEPRPPSVDRAWRIRQGSLTWLPQPLRQVRLTPLGAQALPPPAVMSVLLKEPLPLPPTLKELAFAGGLDEKGRLLALWTPDCAACLGELAGLAPAAEALERAGLGIVPLEIDPAVEAAAADRGLSEAGPAAAFARGAILSEPAAQLTRALFEYVLGRVPPPPVSLLVDAQGQVQLVYLGPLDPARLASDVARFVAQPVALPERTTRPGVWYFRTPRDLLALASDLKARELREDARFYLALDQLKKAGTKDGAAPGHAPPGEKPHLGSAETPSKNQ